MFVRPREETLQNLRKMQQAACVYNNTPCDCKYGASGGEQTGCPELRTAILLLENMSDEQYAELTSSRREQPKLTLPQLYTLKCTCSCPRAVHAHVGCMGMGCNCQHGIPAVKEHLLLGFSEEEIEPWDKKKFGDGWKADNPEMSAEEWARKEFAELKKLLKDG